MTEREISYTYEHSLKALETLRKAQKKSIEVEGLNFKYKSNKDGLDSNPIEFLKK